MADRMVEPQWKESAGFALPSKPRRINPLGKRGRARRKAMAATPVAGTCEDRKFEPEKELIGDLLRNGAMRFGIGLALWAKEEWADLAPPSIFARIRTADADTKAAVKEYAQSKGYTVTKSALDAAQAADLNAWMDRREHPTVEESE